MFKRIDIRDVIAIIIKDIGNERSFLRQHLYTMHVIDERSRFTPPGNTRVHMCTGKIFLSWYSLLRRRTSKGMEIHPVQTGTYFMVECRFLVMPQFIVPMRTDRRERFGSHNLLYINMGSGRGLLDKETILRPRTVRGWRPELAHHNITEAIILHTVQRSGMRSCRLRLDPHVVPVGMFGKAGIMIRGDQMSYRLTEVSQKSIRSIDIIHDMPGNKRQI